MRVPRAVVCSDKFRGSLSAAQATAAMAAGLRRAGFDEVVEIPMADGGEGTLEALLAPDGARRRTEVTGPLGAPVVAEWGVVNSTALVEMAQASGLALVAPRNDPLRASTRGTGQLIAQARQEGFTKIVVGVGGSATTDGGLAAVEAIGWSLQGIEVTVACDVTTTFLDAARVYGPQKGATPAQVALLERRLELVAQQYEKRTGIDVRSLEGGGAAGGLAGGLAALGARLVPGFDVVAELVGLEAALEGADLAVTGEGKFDATSLAGKVVGGTLEWSEDFDVARVAIVTGQATDDARAALSERTDVLVLALTDRVWHARETFERTALLVEEAAVEAGRWALSAPDTPPR